VLQFRKMAFRLDVSPSEGINNEVFFWNRRTGFNYKKWLSENESNCPKVDSSVPFRSLLVKPSKIVWCGSKLMQIVSEAVYT